MLKLSVNYRNCKSKDSHKNRSPSPVWNFGFTKAQYSDKVDQICCWSAMSLPSVTHREDTVLLVRSSDSFSSGFVWNQFSLYQVIFPTNVVSSSPIMASVFVSLGKMLTSICFVNPSTSGRWGSNLQHWWSSDHESCTIPTRPHMLFIDWVLVLEKSSTQIHYFLKNYFVILCWI